MKADTFEVENLGADEGNSFFHAWRVSIPYIEGLRMPSVSRANVLFGEIIGRHKLGVCQLAWGEDERGLDFTAREDVGRADLEPWLRALSREVSIAR